MVRFLGGDHWSVVHQREVDSWVRNLSTKQLRWARLKGGEKRTNQVGLELGEIDIEGTVETQRGGDGGHNLSDEPVQVGVGWPLNVQVPTTNVVNGLVIQHEGAIGMLQRRVSRQDRVVRFDDCRRHLEIEFS